jgi:hypothetical protein
MPSSKNLQHYPARYSEIVRECALQAKRVVVELPDAKKAMSLRGHWYAYIGALKAEAMRRKRGAPASIMEDDICELAAQAEMTMVTVEQMTGGRCRVIWQNRENSWQALAVATAIVTGGDSRPTATTLDETAARLLDIQQEMDDGKAN